MISFPTFAIPSHPTLFSRVEIEAFESEILSDPASNEHTASRFFKHYPKFLLLGEGAEVRREEVLLGANEIHRRVDFFRRSFGKQFWDIIELKGPHKPVVVAGGTHHPHLSAEVLAAISQAQDYRDLVIADQQCRNRLKGRGISVCRPRLIVIAGSEPDHIDAELLEVLYDRIRSQQVDFRSYTDILRFAKDHYAATQQVLLVTCPVAILPYPEYWAQSWGEEALTFDELVQRAPDDLHNTLGHGHIWGGRVLTFHEYMERTRPEDPLTFALRASYEKITQLRRRDAEEIAERQSRGSANVIKENEVTEGLERFVYGVVFKTFAEEYEQFQAEVAKLLKSGMSAEHVHTRLMAMGLPLNTKTYPSL